MSVAAGWYTDPAQADQLRWWDGQAWTEHTRAVAPTPVQPAPVQPAQSVPVQAVRPPEPAYAGAGYAPAPARPQFGSFPAQDFTPYGSGPAMFPSHAVAAGGSSSRGWLKPVLAVALVGVLAAGALVGSRLLAGGGQEAPPAPVRALPELFPAQVPAAEAASHLDTFKPRDGVPAAGASALLLPAGDTLATPTLTGWCGADSRTDKSRVGRRQWVLTSGGRMKQITVEVVAFGSDDAATAAYDEFLAMTKACTASVVKGTKGTVTYRRYKVTTEVPMVSVGSTTVLLREDLFLTATHEKKQGWVSATVQRHGQYLSIVWSGLTVPYAARDLAVISSVTDDQTHALVGNR